MLLKNKSANTIRQLEEDKATLEIRLRQAEDEVQLPRQNSSLSNEEIRMLKSERDDLKKSVDKISTMLKNIKSERQTEMADLEDLAQRYMKLSDEKYQAVQSLQYAEQTYAQLKEHATLLSKDNDEKSTQIKKLSEEAEVFKQQVQTITVQMTKTFNEYKSAETESIQREKKLQDELRGQGK